MCVPLLLLFVAMYELCTNLYHTYRLVSKHFLALRSTLRSPFPLSLSLSLFRDFLYSHVVYFSCVFLIIILVYLYFIG